MGATVHLRSDRADEGLEDGGAAASILVGDPIEADARRGQGGCRAEDDLQSGEAWGLVMPQVSATRSELLARRAQIGLAAQGRDLLKERRSALVREFNRLGASALASIDALDRDAAGAGRLLGLSVAAHGPEPVDRRRSPRTAR